jgi:hypothetical protein
MKKIMYFSFILLVSSFLNGCYTKLAVVKVERSTSSYYDKYVGEQEHYDDQDTIYVDDEYYGIDNDPDIIHNYYIDDSYWMDQYYGHYDPYWAHWRYDFFYTGYYPHYQPVRPYPWWAVVGWWGYDPYWGNYPGCGIDTRPYKPRPFAKNGRSGEWKNSRRVTRIGKIADGRKGSGGRYSRSKREKDARYTGDRLNSGNVFVGRPGSGMSLSNGNPVRAVSRDKSYSKETVRGDRKSKRTGYNRNASRKGGGDKTLRSVLRSGKKGKKIYRKSGASNRKYKKKAQQNKRTSSGKAVKKSKKSTNKSAASTPKKTYRSNTKSNSGSYSKGNKSSSSSSSRSSGKRSGGSSRGASRRK